MNGLCFFLCAQHGPIIKLDKKRIFNYPSTIILFVCLKDNYTYYYLLYDILSNNLFQ